MRCMVTVDVKGYAKAIEDFDGRLPEIMAAMAEDDLLLITADHGMIQLSQEQTTHVNMCLYWLIVKNDKTRQLATRILFRYFSNDC